MRRMKYLQAMALSCVFLATLMKSPSTANAVKSPDLCVLVILDRIDIGDLDVCPQIKQCMKKGSLALMSNKTSGPYSPESSYMTIGAGSYAIGSLRCRQVLNFYEEFNGSIAGNVFESFTGISPDGGNLLVMDIPSILRENSGCGYEVLPGCLGEELQRCDIPVTCLGNADTFDKKNRLSGVIAMDSRGVVHQGRVDSSLNARTISRPVFMGTDYEKLYSSFTHYKGEGGLIVIHLGDLIRIYDMGDAIEDSMYHNHRMEIIKEADSFVGNVSRDVEKSKGLFIVATPFPSLKGFREKAYLTPLMVLGPDFDEGLAISPTTRRPGIVASVDIAPTILAHFGVTKHPSMLGSALEHVPSQNSLQMLIKTNLQVVTTYVQRANIIRSFIAILIATTLCFLTVVVFKPQGLRYIRPMIFASMSVPPALLLLPIADSPEIAMKYFGSAMIITVMVFICLALKDSLKALSFICLLAVLGIIIDLALGSPLMMRSVLGFDPIVGARYYGIGNEYMGVLIGALVMGLMCLLQLASSSGQLELPLYHRCAVAVFFIALFMIASPRYGSNFGGTLAAYTAFFITLSLMVKVRLHKKTTIPLLTGVITVFAVIITAVVILGPPTHISRAFATIQDRGVDSLVRIAERKVLMNWKLFRYTPWTRALVTTIAACMTLFFYPVNILRAVFERYPYVHKGFLGSSMGCMVALAANDSGIVAAATMMIYIALPLFLLVIDEILKKNVV